MTSTQTRKPRETSAQRAKREWDELMAVAEAAGYVSPYPGEVPDSSIEDRCDKCGWTLFLSMRLEVYCVNEKCAEHRRDLTIEEGS